MPRTIIGRGYAATLAVPLWGRFMAAATREHEPTRFKPPRTVVPVTICRLSGKLATSACRGELSYDAEGYLTSHSMAYTEYFTRGTEPTDYCEWHRIQVPYTLAAATPPDPSGATPQAPLPVTTSGVLPTTIAAPGVATRTQQEQVRQPEPEPQKSRGFWGRLFRRGGAREQAPGNPR